MNLQSKKGEREREREKRVEHNGSGPFFFGSLDFRLSRPQRLPPGSKKRKKRWCQSQSDLTRGDGHIGGPSECESDLMPLRHVPSDCQGPPDQYRRQTRLSGLRERERERETREEKRERGREGGRKEEHLASVRFAGFSTLPATVTTAWLQTKKKKVVPISIRSGQR